MKNSINKNLYSFLLLNNLIFSQSFLPADPSNILKFEYNNYINNKNIYITSIRPQINYSNNIFKIKVLNQFFYNSNAPNFENMGNLYIGKGIGIYTGLKISYFGDYLTFTLEPYYFKNQNKKFDLLMRENTFLYLNDRPSNNYSSISNLGMREAQLYLSYYDYGIGISNANLWWGPGIHTSLLMTNNTTGFPHIMAGTLKEKKYRNIGYNFRYVFSELKKTFNNPYFTAISIRLTYYTEPIITFGFTQNILTLKNYINDYSILNAATIFFHNSKIDKYHQTFSTYFILDFPNSNLKFFIEIGSTDRWKNFIDFLNYPDHGIASIIGLRQYGIFNNKNLILGFEYARLAQSSYWDKRPTPNWYDNPNFDYLSYDGRRWGAHSGSDSDDLFIYFGYESDKWSLIPSINYERHGIVYIRPSEVKMEMRLDFRYKINDYYLNFYFEKEWLEHAGFSPNKWRVGSVFWFGIERDLTNMFSEKLGLVSK